MTDLTPLVEQARAWAAEDPDSQTRTELEQVIADVEAGGDDSDLVQRLHGR